MLNIEMRNSQVKEKKIKKKNDKKKLNRINREKMETKTSNLVIDLHTIH